MMDAPMVIDTLLGVLILIMGFVLKRIFHLFDALMKEDKLIHSRVTDLATASVSRQELQGSIDRVISRIDKLEERLMNKP